MILLNLVTLLHLFGIILVNTFICHIMVDSFTIGVHDHLVDVKYLLACGRKPCTIILHLSSQRILVHTWSVYIKFIRKILLFLISLFLYVFHKERWSKVLAWVLIDIHWTIIGVIRCLILFSFMLMSGEETILGHWVSFYIKRIAHVFSRGSSYIKWWLHRRFQMLL